MYTKKHIHNTNQQNNQSIQVQSYLLSWLSNPNKITTHFRGKTSYNYAISPKTIPTSMYDNGSIVIIQQFYIPKNVTRLQELQNCLKINCNNDKVDKIILLNEKLYSERELGVSHQKIQQVVVGSRLTFKHAMKYSQSLENTFVILCNMDIFFDDSVDILRRCDMKQTQKSYALLRYEYNGQKDLRSCKIFGPRPDSQDTWIWHSKWSNIVTEPLMKLLDYQLGLPGCDNKTIYTLSVAGFRVHNEPELIKTYHYHNSQYRPYITDNTIVPPPYYVLFPVLVNSPPIDPKHTFDITQENEELCNQLVEPFIIPQLIDTHNNMIDKCWVKEKHFDAFKLCRCYIWDKPWSQNNVSSYCDVLAQYNKPKIYVNALNVLETFVNKIPWTKKLKGKKLLLISDKIEFIQENKDKEITSPSLFEGNQFVLIQYKKLDNLKEYMDITDKIRDNVDKFDVALINCGILSNALCAEIFKLNKSAIHVGELLPLYFGIYTFPQMKRFPHLFNVFMNNNWLKVKE